MTQFREAERLPEGRQWIVDAVDGFRTVALDAGTVGLTVCQVPFVIGPGDGAPSVEITDAAGRTERIEGDRLDRGVSAAVFERSGAVRLVRAWL